MLYIWAYPQEIPLILVVGLKTNVYEEKDRGKKEVDID